MTQQQPTNQELIDRVETAFEGAMKTPVNSDRQLTAVFEGFVQDLAHAWPDIRRALERGVGEQPPAPRIENGETK